MNIQCGTAGWTDKTLRTGLGLLGIEVLEAM